MIDKKFLVSEQVADLPVVGQLILRGQYHTLTILVFTIFAQVVKSYDSSNVRNYFEEFSKVVALIVSKGLWKEVEYGEDKFYFLVRFREHQTLKRDRQPQTLLKYPRQRP